MTDIPSQEIERMESNFNKALCMATNGRMSKPNYTWKAIEECIQEAKDEDYEKAKAETIKELKQFWKETRLRTDWSLTQVINTMTEKLEAMGK